MNTITTTPIVECSRAEYKCRCGYFNTVIEYDDDDAINKLVEDLKAL